MSAGEVTARNVWTFDAIDGFAVDLTDAEAEEMRKSAGVRYVSRTIGIHAADRVAPHLAPRAEGSPLAAIALGARASCPQCLAKSCATAGETPAFPVVHILGMRV